MKQYLVAALVVLAFLAVAMPASAETDIFQKTADWIASWGKPCGTPCGAPADTAAPSKPAMCAPCPMKTDVLCNVVPTGTVKEGKRPTWIRK